MKKSLNLIFSMLLFAMVANAQTVGTAGVPNVTLNNGVVMNQFIAGFENRIGN